MLDYLLACRMIFATTGIFGKSSRGLNCICDHVAFDLLNALNYSCVTVGPYHIPNEIMLQHKLPSINLMACFGCVNCDHVMCIIKTWLC